MSREAVGIWGWRWTGAAEGNTAVLVTHVPSILGSSPPISAFQVGLINATHQRIQTILRLINDESRSNL